MKQKKETTSRRKQTKKTTSPKSTIKSKSTSTKSQHSRPPVVTFMGHVDHGKTTLLDAIRKSDVVSTEHGGITQHIGAYRVVHKNRQITFIDTPGHAAFAKMRAQGSQVTDVVVLVIAANDGVKPQTREALSHIKAAGVPFLIAINKIDLPDINIERLKGQLAEDGVVVESYGGDVVTVEVSAKTGKNLNQLLDMILLVSDLKERLADPKGKLKAVVIETHQDKQKGIIASLLVKNGTLKVGSELEIGGQKIRVRSLTDEHGRAVTEAGPSTPIELMGFKTMPLVGLIIGDASMSESKQDPVQPVTEVSKKSLTKKETKEEGEDTEENEEDEKQSIKIVLIADVAGTLEAITSNLSDEVEIISKSVGEVTESDVLLADTTKATIIAFNTKIASSAKRLAEIEKVKIRSYRIIYKLFEDLEKQVLKILEPTIDEEVVGEAEVIAVFEMKDEKIAGCKVKTGEIDKTLPIHIKRDDEIISDTKIKSLQREQEKIDKVKAGNECGITFKPRVDFRVKDVIISYRIIDEDV